MVINSTIVCSIQVAPRLESQVVFWTQMIAADTGKRRDMGDKEDVYRSVITRRKKLRFQRSGNCKKLAHIICLKYYFYSICCRSSKALEQGVWQFYTIIRENGNNSYSKRAESSSTFKKRVMTCHLNCSYCKKHILTMGNS